MWVFGDLIWVIRFVLNWFNCVICNWRWWRRYMFLLLWGGICLVWWWIFVFLCLLMLFVSLVVKLLFMMSSWFILSLFFFLLFWNVVFDIGVVVDILGYLVWWFRFFDMVFDSWLYFGFVVIVVVFVICIGEGVNDVCIVEILWWKYYDWWWCCYYCCWYLWW